MSAPSREIYFHAGFGKVASTYLQHRFFPQLQRIRYIHRSQYHRIHDVLAEVEDQKVLISREFDRQMDREVRSFTERYPDTRFFLMMRQHDSWIASQYRRFVKNGMYLSFDEFIDLDNDQGFWKIDDMTFLPRLQLIERITGRRPAVFLHDQLKDDPFTLFDQIAKYLGATYRREDISLKPVHRSYSEKQLKVIRKFRLYDEEPGGDMRKPGDWLKRRWRFLVCYSILYPAALLPASWAPSGDLIPTSSLERIRAHFESDWQACKAYATEGAGFPS
ncbi:MAG: hypothetical protein R3301_10035 [Saprospiraceae bacterium]|nr:hypothetical protein [Saprospiraceae bacterium]